MYHATSASKARRDATVDKTIASIEIGGTHFTVRDSDSWAELPLYRTGALTSTESVAYAITARGKASESASVVAEGRITFEPTQQSLKLRIELLAEDKLRAAGGADGAGGQAPALTLALHDPSRGAA